MSVIAIAMPRLGMTMEEGTVVEWPIPIGGHVEKGETVLIIETEKAESEIEATVSGTLRHVYTEPGETLPCGALLAAITHEPDEAFDVVRDLAIPLPVTVIAEMLGVQGERMRDFKRWSDAIVSAATGTKRDAGLAGMLDPMGEMRQYMASIIPERRRNPKDDLISVLVDPRHEDTLDEDQVFGFIVLLLVAGNETTTNLIGNATVTLLDHPAELEHVQADPALVPQMVEEVLRYDTPVHLLFRSTTQEVELSGGKLPAGAQVAVILASANRDPRVFDDPDRFDVTRTSNTHIAFGFGVHFCLGASLARLEAKVAMEALVPHLPKRRRSSEELDYIDSFLVRGPRSLELIVSA